jgi:maltoporin
MGSRSRSPAPHLADIRDDFNLVIPRPNPGYAVTPVRLGEVFKSARRAAFSDVPQPTPQNKAGFSEDNFDFRFYDFKLLGGTGEFGFDVSHATSGKDAEGLNAPNATGASFTFIHTSEKWLGENNLNKFYIQYGHGPGKTFTSGFQTYSVNGGTFIGPDASGSYRFRVADNL